MAFFANLSQYLNIPPGTSPIFIIDLLSFILGFVCAIPLSYLLKLIKNPQLRLVYCITSGILLQYTISTSCIC